jgi:hypothetical protein
MRHERDQCCARVLFCCCSLSRGMSTAAPPATGKTSFGGLSDQDRIFQNIYGVHDTSIKVRMEQQ